MASLLIRARDLSVGDTLLLPMGRTATVTSIRPFGARARFVQFRTEHGLTRVEVDAEVFVQPKVLA